MTEQVKESLSAWLDGEASEIEIHRLVRHYSADASGNDATGGVSEESSSEALRVSGLKYQHMRTVIRREHRHVGLSHETHVALHARISSAIADEPAHSSGNVSVLAAVKPRQSWVKPVGGLAAAASLVVAVFVGMQLDLQPGTAIDSTANGSTAQVAGRQSTPIAVQTVGTQSYGVPAERSSDSVFDNSAAIYADASNPMVEQTELKALDEEKQRQLRAYLRQHDQMTRMNPNTRTVIYTPPSQP